jgi:hypothetical protein
MVLFDAHTKRADLIDELSGFPRFRIRGPRMRSARGRAAKPSLA